MRTDHSELAFSIMGRLLEKAAAVKAPVNPKFEEEHPRGEAGRFGEKPGEEKPSAEKKPPKEEGWPPKFENAKWEDIAARASEVAWNRIGEGDLEGALKVAQDMATRAKAAGDQETAAVHEAISNELAHTMNVMAIHEQRGEEGVPYWRKAVSYGVMRISDLLHGKKGQAEKPEPGAKAPGEEETEKPEKPEGEPKEEAPEEPKTQEPEELEVEGPKPKEPEAEPAPEPGMEKPEEGEAPEEEPPRKKKLTPAQEAAAQRLRERTAARKAAREEEKRKKEEAAKKEEEWKKRQTEPKAGRPARPEEVAEFFGEEETEKPKDPEKPSKPMSEMSPDELWEEIFGKKPGEGEAKDPIGEMRRKREEAQRAAEGAKAEDLKRKAAEVRAEREAKKKAEAEEAERVRQEVENWSRGFRERLQEEAVADENKKKAEQARVKAEAAERKVAEDERRKAEARRKAEVDEMSAMIDEVLSRLGGGVGQGKDLSGWAEGLVGRLYKDAISKAEFMEEQHERDPEGRFAPMGEGAPKRRGAREPTAEEIEAREAANVAFLDPKHRLKEPIKGPTGAKIVGYQWVSKIEEGEHGQDIRVSAWEEAQVSVPTGRKIVHLFWVQTPDGRETLMGVGAAKRALGMPEKKLYTVAKYEADRQAQEKKNWDNEAKRIETKGATTFAEAVSDWEKANNADKAHWGTWQERYDFYRKLAEKMVVLGKGGRWIASTNEDLIRELKARGFAEATWGAKPTEAKSLEGVLFGRTRVVGGFPATQGEALSTPGK